MSSLGDFAAIKTAIEICNNPQLKRELLCVPGSDYDVNKTGKDCDRKNQWSKLVDKIAAILVEQLGLPKQLQEKVIGIVHLVGMRILTWAEYHEGTLGFSRNYSFKFFNSSFFTTRGLIDTKKAAEELMNVNFLSIKQKYKLALLYCMDEHIPKLYPQMEAKDKKEFYDRENPNCIKQPPFVKFWSYYLMNDIDRLRGDMDPRLFWLEMAVKSGSKDTVKYCLEKTNLIRIERALIYAALEAARNHINGADDWIVFRDHRYDDTIESWVPNHYYVDIVCFLFSKMSQKKQIEFVKQDSQSVDNENDPLDNHKRKKVLEYFLDWPYQDYFMKTARLMWEFLSESYCSDLLQSISYKIGSLKGHYMYGEEMTYDYNKLLRVFWMGIPERHKRGIFRDQEITGENGEMQNVGCLVLHHLFAQNDVTFQNRENIGLILDSATNEEKNNIIFSTVGKATCINLMKSRRWSALDEFVSNCCTSASSVEMFKISLSFSEHASRACIDFITNDEWQSLDSFIRWSSLPEVETNQLKKGIIFSEHGRSACLKIISYDKKFVAVNKAIQWCFLPQDKVIAFKKELLYCSEGMHKCADFVTSNHVELANELIEWGLSFEGNIEQYKKDLVNSIGKEVCEILISDVSVEDTYSNTREPQLGLTIQFNGGKWIEVEMFLTWCFPSEDEMDDFKKSLSVKESGQNHLINIIFNLIRANQLGEAEAVFAWLGLSFQEIQTLKLQTIFCEKGMDRFDSALHDTYLGNYLENTGGQWEELERLLRWCLANKNDLDEFILCLSYDESELDELGKKNLYQFDELFDTVWNDYSDDDSNDYSDDDSYDSNDYSDDDSYDSNDYSDDDSDYSDDDRNDYSDDRNDDSDDRNDYRNDYSDDDRNDYSDDDRNDYSDDRNDDRKDDRNDDSDDRKDDSDNRNDDSDDRKDDSDDRKDDSDDRKDDSDDRNHDSDDRKDDRNDDSDDRKDGSDDRKDDSNDRKDDSDDRNHDSDDTKDDSDDRNDDRNHDSDDRNDDSDDRNDDSDDRNDRNDDSDDRKDDSYDRNDDSDDRNDDSDDRNDDSDDRKDDSDDRNEDSDDRKDDRNDDRNYDRNDDIDDRNDDSDDRNDDSAY